MRKNIGIIREISKMLHVVSFDTLEFVYYYLRRCVE